MNGDRLLCPENLSIDNYVKIYYVTGKGWTEVVSTLWPLEKYLSYIRILHWNWLNMNMTINTHVYSVGAIYSTYDKVVILFWLLNFIDFKTSNVWYSKTTCLIDFKLTGSIVWVNRSLYTNFQAILNFHQNLWIFNFKGHRCLLWSCKYTDKLK